MFIFLKTKYSISHPIVFFSELEKDKQGDIFDYFKHSVNSNEVSENHICPFGKVAIVILSVFLLYKKKYKCSSIVILLITFLLSFMNMNAMVYLIPYFIVEIYIITKI